MSSDQAPQENRIKLPEYPDFVPFRLGDVKDISKLTANYPPYSDLSIATFHIWWNQAGNLAFAKLNNNLVINYDLPFSPRDSGIGLVGDNEVDKSIGQIFDTQQARGLERRLVHVPRFVIDQINEIDLYQIQPEPDFDEYLYRNDALATMSGSEHARVRRRVAKFLRESAGHDLKLESLDLADEANRDLILKKYLEWQSLKPKTNDPGKLEDTAIQRTLDAQAELDTQNICLFIDGRLAAFCLFHLSPTGNCYVLHHLHNDYSFPNMFDYMIQQVAKLGQDNGIEYLNLEMDLGIEGIRQRKVVLRPVQMLEKFTIVPKA